MSIKITCRRCGHENEFADEAAGTTAACAGCEAVLFVPGDEEDGLALAEEPDEMSLAPEQAPPRERTCPKCGEALPPGGVLCVECGYNLSTGQFVITREGGDDRVSGGAGDVLRGLGTYAIDLLERFKWYLTAAVVLLAVGTSVVIWVVGQRRELDRVRREDLGRGKGLGAAVVEMQDGAFRKLRDSKRTDPKLAGPEADRLLLEAKSLHRGGKRDAATDRLRRLVATYPTMTAARKAKTLLAEWGRPPGALVGKGVDGAPATAPTPAPTTRSVGSTTQRRPTSQPSRQVRRREPPRRHRSVAAQGKLKKARRLLRDGDVAGARKHLADLVRYFSRTVSGGKAAEILRELDAASGHATPGPGPGTQPSGASPPPATQPTASSPSKKGS